MPTYLSRSFISQPQFFPVKECSQKSTLAAIRTVDHRRPLHEQRGAQGRPFLPAGTLLAQRYRIGKLLGQGTMGVVYEVTRLTDRRRFAAKLLGIKPDYQAMARFAREAELLARLRHPNLLALVDADVTEDRIAYIIMELGSGKSLAEFYSRYRSCDFMLPILYQIADALAAVHAAGVVHRDLKPGNVLISISADGAAAHAKLVDFGVSRLLDGPPGKLEAASSPPLALPVQAAEPPRDEHGRRAAVTLPLAVAPPRRPAQPATAPPELGHRKPTTDELTEAGMLLGTLLYMAPELSGGAHLAHPSSDIFSFGVMAYELLTGTLPFEEIPLLRVPGHSAGLEFQPLDALCPGVTPALAQVLESCLAIEPTCRPTAIALVGALHQAQRTTL